MNMEGLTFESTPKAISVERMDDGSLSIKLSEQLKEDGSIFNIAAVVESIVSDGLYNVILDIESGSIEVQSFNPTQEVSEDIEKQIEQIAFNIK